MTTLVIGNYRQTLTVVRALGQLRHRVILALFDDNTLCRHSRHVSEVWIAPSPATEKHRFYEALTALLHQRPDIEFVFPIGELEIRWFLEFKNRIPETVTVLAADPQSTALCLDKTSVSQIVGELEIPQPASAVADNLDALLSAALHTGFPCIAKLPSSESLLFGNKALIYQNAAELREDFSAWPVEHRLILLQAYIRGPRLNVYFVASHGSIVAEGQTWAEATDRRDGTGLSIAGRTIEADAQVTKYCDAIVAKLNISGPGCMQFIKDDRTHEVFFLEHNPRLGASLALVHESGLNLPELMLLCAKSDPSVAQQHPYPCRINRRFAWTSGALSGLWNGRIGVTNRRWRNFPLLCRILWRGMVSPVHIIWQRSDPLPFVWQILRYARIPFGRPATARRQDP